MLTCKVIRKVSGNSTVIYDGRNVRESAPRPTPAAPQAPRNAIPVGVDISERIPWTSTNVHVVHISDMDAEIVVTSPEPITVIPAAPDPQPVQAQPQDTHRITAEALLKILKPLPKKKNSYIEIRGNTYPVKTLYDLARLADSDVLNVTIESEIEFSWWEYGRYYKDPSTLKTKKTPALIIRHGSTKTTLIPTHAAPGAAVWAWGI